MHISLTPFLEEYTRAKVDSGLYNNASEVLRESLRLMVQRDQDRDHLKFEVSKGFEQIENGQVTQINSRDEFLKLVRSHQNES